MTLWGQKEADVESVGSQESIECSCVCSMMGELLSSAKCCRVEGPVLRAKQIRPWFLALGSRGLQGVSLRSLIFDISP